MSHFRVFSNVVKEVGGGRARKKGVRSVSRSSSCGSTMRRCALAAVADEHKDNRRRIGRVEKRDPVVELEAKKPREAQYRRARYRRQHPSSVALAAGAAAATVARIRICRFMCVLTAVAGMRAAGIPDVDCALLDVVARSAVCRAAVNGVLVVEAAAG